MILFKIFLIIILRTPVELALGVMLIAAAPGGVTSNVLTKFANGDVALSISLTAITSLISIVSVPYVVFLSIELFDKLSSTFIELTRYFNSKSSIPNFLQYDFAASSLKLPSIP